MKKADIDSLVARLDAQASEIASAQAGQRCFGRPNRLTDEYRRRMFSEHFAHLGATNWDVIRGAWVKYPEVRLLAGGDEQFYLGHAQGFVLAHSLLQWVRPKMITMTHSAFPKHDVEHFWARVASAFTGAPYYGLSGNAYLSHEHVMAAAKVLGLDVRPHRSGRDTKGDPIYICRLPISQSFLKLMREWCNIDLEADPRTDTRLRPVFDGDHLVRGRSRLFHNESEAERRKMQVLYALGLRLEKEYNYWDDIKGGVIMDWSKPPFVGPATASCLRTKEHPVWIP